MHIHGVETGSQPSHRGVHLVQAAPVPRVWFGWGHNDAPLRSQVRARQEPPRTSSGGLSRNDGGATTQIPSSMTQSGLLSRAAGGRKNELLKAAMV